MSYQVKNGCLVKSDKSNKGAADEVSRLVIIGEDEYMICNWSATHRKTARDMGRECAKMAGQSEQEFKSELVAGLGDMLDTGKGQDQENIAYFSAMYAALCTTPNQAMPGQSHNTSAVFILRGKKGYVARWAGRFNAKTDDQALALAWHSMSVMCSVFNLDQEFKGRSSAYDHAMAMFKEAAE